MFEYSQVMTQCSNTVPGGTYLRFWILKINRVIASAKAVALSPSNLREIKMFSKSILLSLEGVQG